MKHFLSIRESPVIKPFPVQYTFLVKQKFTYNIIRNGYSFTGLVYGSVLAFIGYYLLHDKIYYDSGLPEKILLLTIYYFFLLQPLLGWVFLGAVGSLIKIKREYYLESYDKMRETADKDSLTGLFNNRYFKIRAQELFHLAKIHDREFCIIMLDIDDFKKVNDNYGHPEGDRILNRVAKTLRTHSRTSDIPVRYGGEEFLMFLTETNHRVGSTIAERIRKAIDDEIFVVDEKPMNITVSGGLSFFPEDGDQITTLIKVADTRLYKAKGLGKNRIVNRDGEILATTG